MRKWHHNCVIKLIYHQGLDSATQPQPSPPPKPQQSCLHPPPFPPPPTTTTTTPAPTTTWPQPVCYRYNCTRSCMRLSDTAHILFGRSSRKEDVSATFTQRERKKENNSDVVPASQRKEEISIPDLPVTSTQDYRRESNQGLHMSDGVWGWASCRDSWSYLIRISAPPYLICYIFMCVTLTKAYTIDCIDKDGRILWKVCDVLGDVRCYGKMSPQKDFQNFRPIRPIISSVPDTSAPHFGIHRPKK